MKNNLLALLLVFTFTGCVSFYKNPTDGSPTATLVVKPIRVVEGEVFDPDVWIAIDGQRIYKIVEVPDPVFNRNMKIKFPGDHALVKVGLHKVTLDITAFQRTFAKANAIDIEVLFEKDHTYEVSVIIPEVVSEELTGDSSALIKIVDLDNQAVLLSQNLVLKYSSMRSVADPRYQQELMGDIVNGVIIDAAN